MEHWSKRLHEKASAGGLSHAELARQSGISEDLINKYMQGKVDNPRGENPGKLARVLDVSRAWLMLGKKDESTSPNVGLISWVTAGALAEVIDNYAPGDAETYYPYEKPRNGKMIALRVKGNSMNRVSPDGSIVLVDLEDREMSGNRHYIVKIGDETTYKRYKDNRPRLEAYSSDDYDPIYLDDKEIQVVGRVVRTLLDFD